MGIQKPPSEARLILEALASAGMERVAVARALGVKAQALRNIARGQTPGVNLLPRLRALYDASRVQFPDKLPDVPAQPNASERPVPAPVPADAGVLPIDADISAPEPEPDEPRPIGERVKGGLRDFLMGKSGATAVIAAAESKSSAKSAGSLEERQARFVEQITPILALAVVILGDVLVSAPYRPVAPTHPEADAIMRPIVRMAARQLELAGQLSENTIDILASFAALAVYGDRAWHTYKAIHDDERTVESDSPNAGARPGGGAAARAHDSAPHSGASGALRRPAGPRPGADAGPQGEPGGTGHDERTRQHTALLDSVLAADAVGRRQLGVA